MSASVSGHGQSRHDPERSAANRRERQHPSKSRSPSLVDLNKMKNSGSKKTYNAPGNGNISADRRQEHKT